MVRYVLCAMLACGGAAMALETAIGPDGMFEVDGVRTFVLGLYEYPGEDAVLGEVAAAGFNLVMASAKNEELDRLHAAGLGAWLNTGGAIDLGQDAEQRSGALAALVSGFASHPALRVWEVPDEALWNCWYGAMLWRVDAEPVQLRERIKALSDTALSGELEEQVKESQRLYRAGDYAASEDLADGVWRRLGTESPNAALRLSNASERAAALCAGMVEGYKRLKRLDPRHPVWMNHAPRNQIRQLEAFGRAADIVGCDIYPAPAYRTGHSDLLDRSLSAAGAYTDRMQASVPGKPVWMVLQGFGWADLAKAPDAKALENGRRPDYAESRFMAYDAIVHGARGLLYWGTAYIEKDSDLWRGLLKVVRELADLQRVLSARDLEGKPRIAIPETFGSVDRGICVLGKNVDGQTWWLVVNEFQDPLDFTMSDLDVPDGTVYRDAASGYRAEVSDGTLRGRIPAYGVLVLEASQEKR